MLRDLQLGPGLSKHCAKSVFALAKLKSLDLTQVKLDDRFFAVLSDFAPKSLVKKLSHHISCIKFCDFVVLFCKKR